MLLMFLILFSTSCAFIILNALFVVTSRNALHSVLFLAACFFSGAVTIFLLENEFLALFFLIIYLGAIIVLFLFVVMMLDLKQNILNIKKTHFPVGVFIGFLMFYLVLNKVTVLTSNNNTNIRPNFFDLNNNNTNWQLFLEPISDFTFLADILYSNFAPHLIISGVLLYISVIGVIFLTTSSKRRFSSKTLQLLTRQLSRTKIL